MTTVAFDLDGTLLDSRERHRTVMKQVLDELAVNNIDLSDMIAIKSEGKSNKDYLRLKGIDEELLRIICSRWQKIIENGEFLQEDTLYPDALAFLNFLKDRNIRLILITARNNREALYEQIENLGLAALLDEVHIVASGQDTVQEKCKILQNSQAVIFIGDSEVDWEAAQKAAVNFLAVNRGFRNKAFWQSRSIQSFADFDKIKPQIQL